METNEETGRDKENFALKITEPEVRAAQVNLEGQGGRERGLHRKKREKPAATCLWSVLKAVYGSILLAQRTEAFNKI